MPFCARFWAGFASPRLDLAIGSRTKPRSPHERDGEIRFFLVRFALLPPILYRDGRALTCPRRCQRLPGVDSGLLRERRFKTHGG